MKGSELAELSLAVLAHDPPWKPWGIKAGGIDGCGQEPYWACIAGKLKEFYKGDDRVVRALEEAVKLYRELEKRVESHELQGALILRTLAARLESRGFKELAEATRRAEERILDPRVREADRLASAIDRVFLSRELSEAHPVFINPVNPYLVQPYREKLGVSLVARYVKELVEHVLMLLGESRRATIGDPMLLAHLVYSFLEPLWYKVISESGLEPQKYVPPADTRIPTHTVFDHLNAALAALLWTVGGGPSGCMAIVDLAGVQSWISEARRLRDLWAASWIASMLAWKTIEGLVEEYGPGVLVQPPARLNAFYASWLLGRKLGSDPAGRNLKETLDMLGLRLGWPLDPTMPCRAHLALPKEECSGLEDRIKDYYERAWKLFAEKLCEWASKVCSEIEETIEGGGEDSRVSKVCKRLDSLGLCNLDPPLPLRIVIVDVERAWREARSLVVKVYDSLPEDLRKWIEESIGSGGGARESLAKSLFYPIIVLKLAPLAEREASLRLSGRFSGARYLEYARRVYEAVNGNARLCTVCGRGVELFDGSEIAGLVREATAGRKLAKLGQALVELRNDRLCPYCLAKRLLRKMLEEEGLSSDLLGYKVPDTVRDRLFRDTVDSYTARTKLAYDGLKRAVKRLVEVFAENYKAYIEEIEGNPVVGAPARARNSFLEEEDREEIVSWAVEKLAETLGLDKKEAREFIVELARSVESIVLESVHSDSYYKELKASLSSLKNVVEETLDQARREAGRYRRRIALLKLDGDYVGSGVLVGALPFKRDEYSDRVVNISGAGSNNVKKLYETLTKIIDKEVYADTWCEASLEPPSGAREIVAIPTLSYHFTISRALMAQAVLDRDVIEAHRGFLVYAGGDDVLAILPPAVIDAGTGLAKPLALKATIEARKHYWGAVVEPYGFSVLGPRLGGKAYGFVPALAAYGRSGSLVYVDSLHPLWASLRLVGELEESKDVVEYPCHLRWAYDKDVLFHAGESGGIGLIPLSLNRPPKDSQEASKAGAPAVAALSLSWAAGRPIAVDSTPVSGNMPGDLLQYIGLMSRACSEKSRCRHVIALFRAVISRNINTRSRALLERLRLLGPVKARKPQVSPDELAADVIDNLKSLSGASSQEELFQVGVLLSKPCLTLDLLRASKLVFNGSSGKAFQPLGLALVGSIRAFREAV